MAHPGLALAGERVAGEHCAIRSAQDDESALLYAIAAENNACTDRVIAGQDPSVCRIAVLGGTVAGFTAAAESPAGAELACLFVFETFRRQGVGRRLVADLATQLADAGHGCLHIVAQPWADPFFRRIGARRAGWRPADEDVPWSRPELIVELAAYVD